MSTNKHGLRGRTRSVHGHWCKLGENDSTQHLMNSINHGSVNTLWHLGSELVNRRKLDRISLLCFDILGFFFKCNPVKQLSLRLALSHPCDYKKRKRETDRDKGRKRGRHHGISLQIFWSLKIYARHRCHPLVMQLYRDKIQRLYMQRPTINSLLNVMCCFTSSLVLCNNNMIITIAGKPKQAF